MWSGGRVGPDEEVVKYINAAFDFWPCLLIETGYSSDEPGGRK